MTPSKLEPRSTSSIFFRVAASVWAMASRALNVPNNRSASPIAASIGPRLGSSGLRSRSASSSRPFMRVNGWRRSWATLSVTSRTAPSRRSISASMPLRFCASRSNSPPPPRSGTRRLRSPCMISAAVRLSASMRRSVQRAIIAPPPAPSTRVARTDQTMASSIRSSNASRSRRSRPTRSRTPSDRRKTWARTRAGIASPGESRRTSKLTQPESVRMPSGQPTRLPANVVPRPSTSR